MDVDPRANMPGLRIVAEIREIAAIAAIIADVSTFRFVVISVSQSIAMRATLLETEQLNGLFDRVLLLFERF